MEDNLSDEELGTLRKRALQKRKRHAFGVPVEETLTQS